MNFHRNAPKLQRKEGWSETLFPGCFHCEVMLLTEWSWDADRTHVFNASLLPWSKYALASWTCRLLHYELLCVCDDTFVFDHYLYCLRATPFFQSQFISPSLSLSHKSVHCGFLTEADYCFPTNTADISCFKYEKGFKDGNLIWCNDEISV